MPTGVKTSYVWHHTRKDTSPVESPIQTLLRAGRAARKPESSRNAGYRRLGLLIIVATALMTAALLGWLAVHAGL